MRTLYTVLTGIDIIILNIRLILKMLSRWLRQKGIIPGRSYYYAG